jgi:hypothetical protein
MRPDREGPGVVADEVGAVVRDAEVVNYLPLTGVVYLAEGDTVTQQREEAISGFEAPRRRPAFPFDIEGVFRGGADQFAMGETGCSGVVRIRSPWGKWRWRIRPVRRKAASTGFQATAPCGSASARAATLSPTRISSTAT